MATAATKTASKQEENGHPRVGVIPLNKIKENQVALREVNRDSEAYLGLVESVREKGILNPIVVREITDPENGETIYGLVDGLHRYNAAMDAGLKEIPAQIIDVDQAEAEEVQIVGNLHKIDTKPMEYTKQLERLMSRNPLMTVGELAKRLACTQEWLYKRFGLLKLNQNLHELVDEGKIKLSNAYELAKIPPEEQDAYLERAMTMQPGEFTPTVAARVKEIKDARRQGRQANPPQFEPVAHQRKWGEVKEELEKKAIGSGLLAANNVKTPTDAWNLAIAWCCHLDPQSRQEQINKHEKEKAEAEEKKKKRALERAEQKQKTAAEEAAKLRAEQEAATA